MRGEKHRLRRWFVIPSSCSLLAPANVHWRLGAVLVVLMMVMRVLLEPNATVSACTRSGLIQVEVNLGMTQRSSSSIANGLSALHNPDGFLRNHCHSTRRVRLEVHIRLFESRTSPRTRTRLLIRRPGGRVVGALLEGDVGRLGGGGSGGGRRRRSGRRRLAGAGERPEDVVECG